MQSTARFFDRKNFPHGFSRSGVFTLAESDLLENYGRAMQALSDGSQSPQDESDLQFVKEVSGDLPPQSAEAKVWLKYMEKAFGKRRVYVLCGEGKKKASKSSDTADSEEIDEPQIDVVDDELIANMDNE